MLLKKKIIPGQSSGVLSFFSPNLQLFLHYPFLSLYFFIKQKELHLRSCCCSPSNSQVLSSLFKTNISKQIMTGSAQMCRKRRGDRGLSCQPPAITLPWESSESAEGKGCLRKRGILPCSTRDAEAHKIILFAL